MLPRRNKPGTKGVMLQRATPPARTPSTTQRGRRRTSSGRRVTPGRRPNGWAATPPSVEPLLQGLPSGHSLFGRLNFEAAIHMAVSVHSHARVHAGRHAATRPCQHSGTATAVAENSDECCRYHCNY